MKKTQKLEALKSELFTSTALKNVYGGGWIDDAIARVQSVNAVAAVKAKGGTLNYNISVVNGQDIIVGAGHP
jgi:hypothetical protein